MLKELLLILAPSPELLLIHLFFLQNQCAIKGLSPLLLEDEVFFFLVGLGDSSSSNGIMSLMQVTMRAPPLVVPLAQTLKSLVNLFNGISSD